MFNFVDVPKPKAWPLPKQGSERERELLSYGARRDPVGDKVHTWFACLFLFCLPLATSPASISMALLFGYSLLRLPTTWRMLTPLIRSSVYWSVLAWAIYSTISISWSSDTKTGWDHASSMWLMAVPLPVLLWPILRKWKWLIIAGLAGVFLQNILQLSQIIVGPFLDGHDWISIAKNNFRVDLIPTKLTRPIGLDNHEGNGSLFVGFALLIWLSVLIGKKNAHRWLLLMATALASYGLVVAQSRAILFGLAVSLAFFFFLGVVRKLISPKTMIAFVGVFIIIVSLGIVTLSKHDSSIYHRILEIPIATKAYFVEGTVNTGVDERLNWYTTEFRQSFDEPVFQHTLIGHGLGSTTEIDFSLAGQSVANTTVHPHNAFIQIIYEGGLFGFGLFLLIFINLCRVAQNINNDIYTMSYFSCIFLWVIAAFFDGGQNSGRVLALLMLLVLLSEFYKQLQTQTVVHESRLEDK